MTTGSVKVCERGCMLNRHAHKRRIACICMEGYKANLIKSMKVFTSTVLWSEDINIGFVFRIEALANHGWLFHLDRIK